MELNGMIGDFLEGTIKTIGKVPVIQELDVTENGTYTAPSNVDGYNPVKVNVPEPVLDSISITENGTYTPSSNIDGYNEIEVNVPEPVLDSISITENGTYTPPSNIDGYDEINVEVLPDLETLTATANGSYIPSTGKDGFSSVSVNVPLPEPVLAGISITSNGTYTPPSNIDGYNNIVVNVQPSFSWILNNVYIGQVDNMQYYYQYNFDQPITSGMYIFQLKTMSNNIISEPVGIYFDGTHEAKAYVNFGSYGFYIIRLNRTHFFFSFESGSYLAGQVYCKMSTIDITGHTY